MTLAGSLLVASPLMGDPNFARSVVLVLEDNKDGTMGVIVNRPSTELVAHHVPMWADTVCPPDVVFFGGPVMTDVAIGLGYDPAVPTEDWEPLFGAFGIVDVAFGPDHWGGLEGARIFAGYAGWAPGQLALELAEDAWIVCDSLAEDPTDADPETLWSRVLARQSGRVALYALFPRDLSSN